MALSRLTHPLRQGFHQVSQTGLELTVLVLQPPEYLRYTLMPPGPLCSYLKCTVGHFNILTPLGHCS